MRALVITNSITRRDEKSLDKYLNEISKYDVLTPDEEYDLFKRYQHGDESAFSRIVLHNLRFVVSVAKHYQHVGLWLGDLINEGNIGLIKAARRFDITKGFKFISYAVWWIRQSILQAINEKSRKIRIPVNMHGQHAKIRDTMIEILQQEEREPTLAEIEEATGLPEHTIKRCMRMQRKCASLDAPVAEDSDSTMVQFFEDESIPDPDHQLAVQESRKKEIESMLQKLPKRQAIVISMYYGIGKKEPYTLSDIAEYIGLSRERVRQIKKRALLKLRAKVREPKAASA